MKFTLSIEESRAICEMELWLKTLLWGLRKKAARSVLVPHACGSIPGATFGPLTMNNSDP